jgi:uncharacterized protein
MTKSTTTSDFAVNVRDLLRSPGARRHVSLRGPLPDLRTPVAAVDPGTPVTVEAEVAHVVDGLLVSGQAAATVRLSCGRCLTDFTSELRVAFSELFALDPTDAEDDGYAVQPGDLLPLDTLARDELVLAFPPAPLCRADCAGLCPDCGADRNTTACGHDTVAVDPRWLPLAQLGQAGQDQRND